MHGGGSKFPFEHSGNVRHNTSVQEDHIREMSQRLISAQSSAEEAGKCRGLRLIGQRTKDKRAAANETTAVMAAADPEAQRSGNVECQATVCLCDGQYGKVFQQVSCGSLKVGRCSGC